MPHDVLGVIEKIEGAQSPTDVVHEVGNTLSKIGADHHCLLFLPSGEEKEFAEVSVHWHAPDAWKEVYNKELFKHDPALDYARHTLLPFDWAEAPNNNGLDEKKVAEVRAAAVEHKVDKGICVPILGSEGAVGSLWVAGPHFDERKRFKPLLHTLAHYAFLRTRKLIGVKQPHRARLSGREKDILSWIYRGKTAWEIGEILGISQRTVEWHTQRLMRKLDAPNRVQAVLLAISDRLIVPMLLLSMLL